MLKVTTLLVDVYGTVRDTQGVIVPDLGKEDFVISNDSIAPTVSFFSHGRDLPFTVGLLVTPARAKPPSVFRFCRGHRTGRTE